MIIRIGNEILATHRLICDVHSTRDKKQPLGEYDYEISKELLVEIIADKYCRNILRSTIDSPKSAVELANYYAMPLNTVYRKLRFLVKNKIVKISGVITSDGKKTFLYQSKISDIKIHHIYDSLVVEVIPNDTLNTINSLSGISCPICKVLSEYHKLYDTDDQKSKTDHANNLGS